MGGSGHDQIFGGTGNDTLDGDVGNDIIKGEGGDDQIDGGEGSDAISGGDGDDSILTGPSDGLSAFPPGDSEDDPDWPQVPPHTYSEIVTGGAGWDSIDATQATGRVYVDAGAGPDTVHGGTTNVTNVIYGGLGIDTITGGDGADELHGDAGDDSIYGGGGNDQIFGDDDNDTIEGDDGSDTITGGAGDDLIYSGSTIALQGPVDQPYNGVGPNVNLGYHDMVNSGGGGYNLVDFHVEPDDGGEWHRRRTLFDGSTVTSVSTPLNVFADPGWQGFTFVLDQNVTYGTLTLNSDGSFTYTPQPGKSGIDQFKFHAYWAVDGDSDTTNVATFTIKVGDWDIAPASKQFTLPKPAGGAVPQLNVPAPGLLDGMSNFNQVQLVGSQPANGAVTVNPDGSFNYTPSVGFVGTDSFAYQATDSSGGQSDVLTAEIDVPDYSTRGFEDDYEGAPATAIADAAPGVLWNDQWADTALLISHDPTSNGSLTLNTDGSFNFQPAAGFSGNYSFTYQAKDSVTGHTSDPTTVTLYVSPIAAADDTYSMAPDDGTLDIPAASGILANDTGANQAILIDDDGPAFGSVTLNADGSFTYNAPAGFIGTDFFDYYAINTTTGATSVPISVTINVGPHANDDDYSLAAGSTLNISAPGLLANDSQAVSSALATGGDPANGSVTVNTDGSFTYTPNAGFTGDDFFQYVALDSAGNQSPPATVAIHVTQAIQVIAHDDAYSIAANSGAQTFAAPGVMANDTNADTAEPTGAVPAHGSLTLNANGSFTYTPTTGFSGDDTFQYHVHSQAANVWSSPATVTMHVISITAVADRYSVPSGAPTLNVGAPGVLSNDIGADSAVLVSGLAQNSGTLNLHTDGSFDYSPNASFIGDDTFQYKVHNQLTSSDSAPTTVTLHVGLTILMIADIDPGSGSSASNGGFAFNGFVYFPATNGASGVELWKTDGTEAGTSLVADIAPGGGSSSPQGFAAVNGQLYFTANDGSHGNELWRTDGATGDTVMVKDIQPGSSGSRPFRLTNLNGTLLFLANDGSNGYELWRSDGTADGTVMVSDLSPGSASIWGPADRHTWDPLAEANGALFFEGVDPSGDVQLWKSDGTAAGTALLKDFGATAYTAMDSYFANLNGLLLFAINRSTYDGGQLWRSDGTVEGTELVRDFVTGCFADAREVTNLTVMGSNVFFSAPNGSSAGGGLWKSDGTPDGTILLKDIDPQAGYWPSVWSMTVVNDTLYFTGTSNNAYGAELWKTDGTTEGTILVKDINPGTASSGPNWLTNVDGELFFTANDGVHGTELWQSDGTSAGTGLVLDVNPNGTDVGANCLIEFGGMLLFFANDGIHGWEPWIVMA